MYTLKKMGVWDTFWWWDLSLPKATPLAGKYTTSSFGCPSVDSRDESSLKSRKKRISLPDLRDSIVQLLKMLDNHQINGFRSCEKIERKNSKHLSGRQSKFIGVSKNGNYWQVLKNFNKVKKYIGGYTNELEAAIAYDFYSMVIDHKRARTNFSYTKEEVKEMVNQFVANNQQFVPSLYLYKGSE